MDRPAQATPVTGSRDPLAVAIGNASFLGVGYLMMGLRRLAAGTGAVTVGIVVLLATVDWSPVLEIVAVIWWAGLVAHGWFVAGGRTRRVAVRRQRVIALAVTVPVLLAVGLLRFDAARIERAVIDAQRSGDCVAASTALDRVWFGHRVADGPLTIRTDRTRHACQRLGTAGDELTAALTGDTDALKAGFDGMAGVLAELPGHEKMVDMVLDRFLAGLPTNSSCHTAAVTDWLRQRPASNNALDRSTDVIPRTAPAALVGCGDDLMAAKDWQRARARYQQLLDQYPGHELTAKAQDGVRQATLAIELARVRALLQDGSNGQPQYCSSPAQYSGAPPYGPGINRALIYGNDGYANRLPPEWRSGDPADAVLVVCAGTEEPGTVVRSCPYTNSLRTGSPTNVAFHRIAIPVKAYELRTGRLVVDTKVEIGGASCPPTIEYTTYSFDLFSSPPSDMNVVPSDADVRAGFAPLITPGR